MTNSLSTVEQPTNSRAHDVSVTDGHAASGAPAHSLIACSGPPQGLSKPCSAFAPSSRNHNAACTANKQYLVRSALFSSPITHWWHDPVLRCTERQANLTPPHTPHTPGAPYLSTAFDCTCFHISLYVLVSSSLSFGTCSFSVSGVKLNRLCCFISFQTSLSKATYLSPRAEV